MSEVEFYGKFGPDERAQLIATYRSQKNRETVMASFPVPLQRGKDAGVS